MERRRRKAASKHAPKPPCAAGCNPQRPRPALARLSDVAPRLSPKALGYRCAPSADVRMTCCQAAASVVSGLEHGGMAFRHAGGGVGGVVAMAPGLIGVVVRRGVDVMWLARPRIKVAGGGCGGWEVVVDGGGGAGVGVFCRRRRAWSAHPAACRGRVRVGRDHDWGRASCCWASGSWVGRVLRRVGRLVGVPVVVGCGPPAGGRCSGVWVWHRPLRRPVPHPSVFVAGQCFRAGSFLGPGLGVGQLLVSVSGPVRFSVRVWGVGQATPS